jgi:hypothetical protein
MHWRTRESLIFIIYSSLLLCSVSYHFCTIGDKEPLCNNACSHACLSNCFTFAMILVQQLLFPIFSCSKSLCWEFNAHFEVYLKYVALWYHPSLLKVYGGTCRFHFQLLLASLSKIWHEFLLCSQEIFRNVLLKNGSPENFALQTVQEAIKPQVLLGCKISCCWW